MKEALVLFLTTFIAFLGQIIGELLARISPEEMKHGKRYFLFFEVFFIFVIALLGLILFFKFELFSIISLVFGIIVGLFFRKIYGYFAGVLFSLNSGLLFLFSSLIFIYGLFYGTLNRPFLIKNIKGFIFDFVLFFFVGFFIWFFNLNIINFFIGGLISQVYLIIRKNYNC